MGNLAQDSTHSPTHQEGMKPHLSAASLTASPTAATPVPLAWANSLSILSGLLAGSSGGYRGIKGLVLHPTLPRTLSHWEHQDWEDKRAWCTAEGALSLLSSFSIISVCHFHDVLLVFKRRTTPSFYPCPEAKPSPAGPG